MANGNTKPGVVVSVLGAILAAIIGSSTLAYNMGRGLGARNEADHASLDATLVAQDTMIRQLAEDRTAILTRLQEIPTRDEVRSIVREELR